MCYTQSACEQICETAHRRLSYRCQRQFGGGKVKHVGYYCHQLALIICRDQLRHQKLGVGVGSFTDKDNDTDSVDIPLPETGQLQDANRRRFSRNALVSSAVLLSLANRSAWGGQSQTMGVMSLATLNSFNPTTGLFISTPAQTTRQGHNVGLAKEIHRIADPPSYLGTDGTYTTCKDPSSFENIILIKGKNCS
jgi:hypothetical protein